MTDIQIEIFWREVDLIQQRHCLFFPDEQKQLIRLLKDRDSYQLSFLSGYDLPDCITSEIQFCLRLVKDME